MSKLVQFVAQRTQLVTPNVSPPLRAPSLDRAEYHYGYLVCWNEMCWPADTDWDSVSMPSIQRDGEGQRKKTYTDFTTHSFYNVSKDGDSKEGSICATGRTIFPCLVTSYHFEGWLMAIVGESKQTVIHW